MKAAARSASCPFCKGGIQPDLLQFGGNCPHCLLEIPGEEAPTDPGAVARQKAAVEAAARAKSGRNRNIVYGMIAVFLLSVGGGVAVWQARQERAARTYEMPDDLYLPPLQEAVVPTEPSTAPEAMTPVATPNAKRPVHSSLTSLGGPPSLGDATVPDALTTNPPVETPQVATGPRHASTTQGADAPLAISASQGNSLMLESAPITGAAGGKPLSDEGEVFAMLKQVMSRYNPQIQSCYNTRLKQVPDLAGGWKLSFSVAKDGSTHSVQVDPVANHDSQLEACLVKTVSAWKFAPLTYEQPVTKTVRFGAAGW